MSDTPSPYDGQKQPARRFNAEGHGTRQQFAAFQDAAGSPPTQAAGAGGAAPPSSAPAPLDFSSMVFGPGEQTPQPAGFQPVLEPDDPDLALRVLYSVYPHPDILFLLEQRQPR